MNPNPITLSTEQRRVVEAHGPLLVDAPPGGGKTSVLAWRVAHLVESGGADIGILAVTFSARAAHELRERLDRLISPDQIRHVTVCTLHSLGLRILRESGHVLGYTRDERGHKPGVCNPLQARVMLAQAIEQAQQSCDTAQADPVIAQHIAHLTTDDLAALISAQKAEGTLPDCCATQTQSNDPLRRAITHCYVHYQRILLQHNLVDFDDLIVQPLALLDRDAETCSYYQAHWQHILVDEFQDLSPAQYHLVRALTGAHRNLTLIGDPHQSIYAFRYAMGAEGFERFRRDFPAAQVVYLPHNFRSAGNIVALAETLLGARQWARDSHNRVAHSAVKPPGAPVYLFPTNSEYQEAELVVEQISAAVSAGFARYDECAVLCRTNAQVRLIERALVNCRVPCMVIGEGSFFDHSEVKLVCGCLRLATDFTADSLALKELLDGFRWLSDAARAAIKGDAPDLLAIHFFDRDRCAGLSPAEAVGLPLAQNALRSLDQRKNETPENLIAFVLAEDGLGYREYLLRGADGAARVERVVGLAKLAHDHTTIQSLLDELDTMSGYDPLSLFARDRVQIMTLHSAKGLEFKLVFIVGMEEGLIPHHNAMQTERGRQEELRLVYVGLTRAADVLCLTFARLRDGHPRQSSPWLRGLPHVELRRKPDWRALAA